MGNDSHSDVCDGFHVARLMILPYKRSGSAVICHAIYYPRQVTYKYHYSIQVATYVIGVHQMRLVCYRNIEYMTIIGVNFCNNNVSFTYNNNHVITLQKQ